MSQLSTMQVGIKYQPDTGVSVVEKTLVPIVDIWNVLVGVFVIWLRENITLQASRVGIKQVWDLRPVLR